MYGARTVDEFATRHRRGILITLDALVWAVAIPFFLSIRLLDVLEGFPLKTGLTAVAIAVGLHLVFGTVFWLYDGRYKVGSKDEALVLGLTVLAATLGLQVISFAFPGGRLLPASVPLAAGCAALLGCFAGRMLMRQARESRTRPDAAKPALIFGVGSAGEQLTRNLLIDPASPYLPVGFLDDDASKRHVRVNGVRCLGNRTDLAKAVEQTGAQALLIAVPTAGAQLFRDLSEISRELNLEVKVLPGLSQLLDSQSVGFQDLRDIDITDLLGRAQLNTDVASIAGYLKGKRVLVTGAGGSIGSELCRQIARFGPAKLLMLDRDESALQSVQLSISGHGLLDSDDVILCDIRDAEALREVFLSRQPQVVFHAAALKHLPMLEQYPQEAWKTNVLGTRLVLEAARDVDVEAFVNISTDKAANPSSVLGYSKRIAERLTAAFSRETRGKFVSVRFGNVLGSRGSMLGAFTEQINRGGPVTVTDPAVTRFFMTIPEACELVIQAAAVGADGDALVLDMGEPVRILDVAKQLIDMSGRDDVEIVFTGLRVGEKLHEELFGDEESPRGTSHKLVRAVSVPTLDPAELDPRPNWAHALES